MKQIQNTITFIIMMVILFMAMIFIQACDRKSNTDRSTTPNQQVNVDPNEVRNVAYQGHIDACKKMCREQAQGDYGYITGCEALCNGLSLDAGEVQIIRDENGNPVILSPDINTTEGNE